MSLSPFAIKHPPISRALFSSKPMFPESFGHGCGTPGWIRTSDLQAQIEPTLALKNNHAYGQAVRLLSKVRELMIRLNREADFRRYLEAVRAAHKPKRNFTKLLDAARWKG